MIDGKEVCSEALIKHIHLLSNNTKKPFNYLLNELFKLSKDRPKYETISIPDHRVAFTE